MSLHPRPRPVLAIMAKAPRTGQVKTRLCPPLTARQAAALARAFLRDAIEQVRGVHEARPAIAYTPAHSRPLFASLAPEFCLVAQRGADLGSRMLGALSDLGGTEAGVLLVGSDIPTLDPEVLDRAVRLVGDPLVELVLGPSGDGGYYLIGSRAPHPELFTDMPWSTAAVLDETVRRARTTGLRVELLPPALDVDTGGDLERLEAALDALPASRARHTRRALASRQWGRA